MTSREDAFSGLSGGVADIVDTVSGWLGIEDIPTKAYAGDAAPTTPAPQSISEPPQGAAAGVTKPNLLKSTSLPSLPKPQTTSSVVEQIKSADSTEDKVHIALDFARRNPAAARQMAEENPMLAMKLYSSASDLGLSLGDLGISGDEVGVATDSDAMQQALIKPIVQQSQQANNPWSQHTPGQQAQQPTGPQAQQANKSGSGFTPIWGKTDPWDDFAHSVATGMVARRRERPGLGAGAAFLSMTRRGYLRRLGMDEYLTGANAQALFRDVANRAGGMLPRTPPVSGVSGATLPTGGEGGQVAIPQQQGQQQPLAPAATTMAHPPSVGMPTEVESFERIMQSMGMDPAGAPELMRSLGAAPTQEEDPARTLEEWAKGNPMAAMQAMADMPSGGYSGGGMGGGLADIPTKAISGAPWTPAAAGVGGAVGAAEALGGVGDVAGGAAEALGGLAGGAADIVGGLIPSGGGVLETVLGAPIALIEGIIGGLGGLLGGGASAAVAAPAALAGTVASTTAATVGGVIPVLGGLFSGLGTVLQGISSVALMPFGV